MSTACRIRTEPPTGWLRSSLASIVILLAAGAAPCRASVLLWSNPFNGNSTTEQSVRFMNAAPAVDSEVADDFDVQGSVERIIVHGYGCVSCAPPPVEGVYVRFWQWTPTGPGAMQAEHFLGAGDPGFVYDAGGPDELDLTLPAPFGATGSHFVSVQMVFDDWGYWNVWFSSMNNPQGSAIRYRDIADGGSWGPHVDFLGNEGNHDIAFDLYGTPDDGTPPALVNGCGQWVVHESPDPAGAVSASLHDVVVLGAGNAWAVGDYAAPVQGNTARFSLIEHFDGSAWSVVPAPSPSPSPPLTHIQLDAVNASGPADVWAVGSKNDYDSVQNFIGTHSLALHYDGGAWSEIPIPPPPGGSSPHQNASGDRVFDVKTFGADDAWLVGRWFHFLPSDAVTWPAMVMHYDGSGYEVFSDPFFDQYDEALAAIDGTSSGDLWAVGVRTQPLPIAVVYHYDGANWSEITIPTPGDTSSLSEVRAIAPDDVWVTGTFTVGTFPASTTQTLALHFDGAGWTQFDSPAGGGDLAVIAPDDIYTWGLGGLAHFDGAAWSAEPMIDGIPGAGFGALAVNGPCDLWAVGSQLVAGDQMTFTARIEPVDPAPDPVPGDVNGDGLADVDDIVEIILRWGPCGGPPAPCSADLSGDGFVGIDDIVAVVLAWSL